MKAILKSGVDDMSRWKVSIKSQYLECPGIEKTV